MPSTRPGHTLVIGAGSIGRRHLSNLRQLGVTDLSAFDPNPERLAYVREHFRAKSVTSVDEGLRAKPEMVLICTPPCHHVVQALQAIRAGAHVFIEKPVSHSEENLQRLLAEEEKNNLVVQVGYNLRFHPPIQKLKELVAEGVIGKILWGRIESGSYLPDWRPWQDYRESYTARRELGGGIILDGSHELDYVSWLFGPPAEIACMAGKVSNLEIDVEDCATVLMRFANGSQVDVHVDFMERFYTRGCVLAGEKGKIQWDFKSNEILVQRCGEDANTFRFECEINEMYLTELRHFYESIENGHKSAVTLEEGILTLRIALAARTAAEERRWLSFGA